MSKTTRLAFAGMFMFILGRYSINIFTEWTLKNIILFTLSWIGAYYIFSSIIIRGGYYDIRRR